MTGDDDVNEFFAAQIESMLEEAEEWKEEFPNAPLLPLLRLRYEHSGALYMLLLQKLIQALQ